MSRVARSYETVYELPYTIEIEVDDHEEDKPLGPRKHCKTCGRVLAYLNKTGECFHNCSPRSPEQSETRAVIPPETPACSDAVIEAVCRHFGVTVTALESYEQTKPLRQARKYLMFLLIHDGTCPAKAAGETLKRNAQYAQVAYDQIDTEIQIRDHSVIQIITKIRVTYLTEHA